MALLPRSQHWRFSLAEHCRSAVHSSAVRIARIKADQIDTIFGILVVHLLDSKADPRSKFEIPQRFPPVTIISQEGTVRADGPVDDCG
jgi:hypothetical protein